MDLIKGIRYNLRGIKVGLKIPRLLLLGLARLVIFCLVTVILAGFILVYHKEIIDLIWSRPESKWILWLWYLVSWLLTTILILISSVISYILSQILFAVVIMDSMSRITEAIITDHVTEPEKKPLFSQLFFLIKQEIPRAVIPLIVIMILTLLSWLTPFGPVLTVISSLVTVIFLSWDNSDLVPARRLYTFRERFGFLIKSLSFHLGFGLLFLIPFFNILALSFAPVGATLFFIERYDPEH
jgi:CysZ protein